MIAKKLLLATAAACVLAISLVIGIARASSASALQPIVPPQNQLAFEVASIKGSPANRYVPAVVDPQRFSIVTTLAGAILWANDFSDRDYKLFGGPSWIHRDYYQFESRTQSPADDAPNFAGGSIQAKNASRTQRDVRVRSRCWSLRSQSKFHRTRAADRFAAWTWGQAN